MNPRLKTIVVTAVATTFFWVAAIILVFWIGGKRDDRIQAQFRMEKGSFGFIDTTNTKTQTVTLTIEELPTDANTTGRVELIRHELAPGQRFRVGFRELMGKSR